MVSPSRERSQQLLMVIPFNTAENSRQQLLQSFSTGADHSIEPMREMRAALVTASLPFLILLWLPRSFRKLHRAFTQGNAINTKGKVEAFGKA